jgi:hypothetical protein
MLHNGAGSRLASMASKPSQDLALLELATSASADLRYRRAESLLPCGLTQDELNELLGRITAVAKTSAAKGGKGAPAAMLGGGVTVTAGGPAGSGARSHEQ